MFRKASSEDVKAIVELENELFVDHWNEQQYLYELNENKFSTTLLLYQEDILVGYINFWILFEDADINKVAIRKEYQRHGYGHSLLKEALKIIDNANCLFTHLEVRESNVAAINLYEKEKFKKQGEKKHYYDDGEDAYIMIRSIGDVYER